MNINHIKAQIKKLNLKSFKVIQIKPNSLLLLNSRYKFSDCIYINLYNNEAEIIHDRVFDNEYFYKGIEKLLISKTYIKNSKEVINYIQNILNSKRHF